MKNENKIVLISAVAIIAIMGIILVRRKPLQDKKKQEYTPEQVEAAKNIAKALSTPIKFI
jgi:hypothetical protein